ncbi:MAG: sugar phosphate isomerase/epimerase [Candidatus Helarchaeota archaeon]|nr:sugar phosphate isomerase/epimerase [Candidatus Helarchaeota archaeon]
MKKRILLGLDRGVWKFNLENICQKCVELQLDGLEIQPEHPEIFKNFPDNGGLKKVLTDYDLKYNSIHAPIKDINISSYNPRIREISLSELKRTIKFAEGLSDDVLYVVIHGGQNSFRSASTFEKAFLPKAINFTIEACKELMKDCEEYGLKLSIENMTYSPWRLSSKIKYLDQIFEQVPELKFTFDFHHGVFGSERYTFRILKKYLDRLISVHIGNLFEIKKINTLIKRPNPHIIIEPHHLRRSRGIFEQLQILVKQIQGLY